MFEEPETLTLLVSVPTLLAGLSINDHMPAWLGSDGSMLFCPLPKTGSFWIRKLAEPNSPPVNSRKPMAILCFSPAVNVMAAP